jgi:hypothetical protein
MEVAGRNATHDRRSVPPRAPQPVAGASGDGAAANHPAAQAMSSTTTTTAIITYNKRLVLGFIAVPPGLVVAPPPS